MVRPIMRDPLFLAQKSEPVTEANKQVVQDLLDTLKANQDRFDGVNPCTRYKEIKVDYLDQNFKPQHGKYTGWTAQIIQHELDHVAGIVI